MKNYCPNCFREIKADGLLFKDEQIDEIDIVQLEQYTQYGLKVPELSVFQHGLLHITDYKQKYQKKVKGFVRQLNNNKEVICKYCHFDLGFELDHIEKSAQITVVLATKTKQTVLDKLSENSTAGLFPSHIHEESKNIEYVKYVPFPIDEDYSNQEKLKLQRKLLLQSMMLAGASFVVLLDELSDSMEGLKSSVIERYYLFENLLSIESNKKNKIELLVPKPKNETLVQFVNETFAGSVFQNLLPQMHEIEDEETIKYYIGGMR